MATDNLNNILDPDGENNFLFLASVIAVLCEQSPITIRLEDIERYWSGEIHRLYYDMARDEAAHGSITFSLKDKV